MCRSILIVEDSLFMSTHLQFLLKKEMYNVVGVCVSGEDAVDYLRNHSVDLVFMDILLDGNIDGIEATKLINQFSSVPIVFVSGFSDHGTISRAINTTKNVGAIVKPYDETYLLERLRQFFNDGSLFST